MAAEWCNFGLGAMEMKRDGLIGEISVLSYLWDWWNDDIMVSDSA